MYQCYQRCSLDRIRLTLYHFAGGAISSLKNLMNIKKKIPLTNFDKSSPEGKLMNTTYDLKNYL